MEIIKRYVPEWFLNVPDVNKMIRPDVFFKPHVNPLSLIR
jgi:hypothetical protein